MALRIAGFTIIGSATPGEDPVTTGYLWADIATGKLKQATSVAPYVWTEIGPFAGSATPLAHAASHAAAGSDPVTLSESQITGLTTDLAAKEVTANKNAASGYAGLDGSSKLTGAQQVYGTLVNTACVGNDSRLSDSRTPTAHAASHAAAGSDPLTLSQSQITGLVAALATIPAAASTVTGIDGTTTAVGVGTTYARADHQHKISAAAVLTGNVTLVGDGINNISGFLKTTFDRTADGFPRAGIIARRNSQFNSGTPTVGDGHEFLAQLQDTAGNYHNAGGFIVRMVDVTPAAGKGRLELAAKGAGTFDTTFDVTHMIVDWSGRIGIGAHWGTITNAPTEMLHVYDGDALIENSGVGGASGWCLLAQSQRWNMSTGSDKSWAVYDFTAGVNRITIAPSTGVTTFGGTIVGAMNLPVYTSTVVTSQTLASGQICNIFGTLTITAGTITLNSGASMNIMGIPNGI